MEDSLGAARAVLELDEAADGARVAIRFEGASAELTLKPRSPSRSGKPLFETERFAGYGSVPRGRAFSPEETSVVKRMIRLVRDLIANSEGAAAPLTREILGRFESESNGLGAESLAHESILRVTFACNQECGFCFVDLDDRMVPISEIERRLDAVGERSRADEDLVISGGEPTAHPKLPEIVALARARGFQRITIQTNAVYLAKKTLVERLGGAAYFVSFHSHVPAIYDRLTRSRRQFPLAVQGIQNLLGAGNNQVVLNTIINRANYELLPDYVAFIDRMREGADLSVFFSVLNDVGLQRTPDLAVDLSRVSPFLDRAVRGCRERGIRVENLAGNCAPPACLVSESAAYEGRSEYSHDDVHYRERFDGNEVLMGRAKRPSCRECRHDKRCRGVAVRYAQMFGLEALRPVAKG